MSDQLSFHVLILPNAPWEEIANRFRQCEELGLDAAGMGDHFVDWTSPPRPWFEMWSVLSAVAAQTSRLRIQTSVAQIPFRNPALFARQALTVDHISGGRLDLGIGTGLVSDPSYEMMGMPNWDAGERVDRLAEYIDVVDQLLSNEVTTYSGAYYSVEEAYMNPRPIQQPRPPITVGALGPRMLRLAAEKADVWDSLSFSADLDEQMDETASRMAALDEHCRMIGRDPATITRSYLMFDAEARPSGGSINYYESPELFSEIVRRVSALGITEIGVYYPALEEQIPQFEALAREVIPELRGQ